MPVSWNPDIGDLEAEVLRCLKSLRSATAGQVLEDMSSRRPLAYTTVSTTLDRLYKKGLVSRKAESGPTGQRYVYSFSGNPGLEKQVVNKMVDKLVAAFGPSVASSIFDRLNELTPDEAAKLGSSIRQLKASKRRAEADEGL